MEADLILRKAKLIRSVLQGRQDIVPKYWKNKSGKAGYAPICRNEWKRPDCEKGKRPNACLDCRKADYVPLSDKLIADHLVGKQILGVYPLLPDNRCAFVAADFDNHKDDKNPLTDIKSLHTACQMQDLRCYTLRSKSGKGYHAYIFFDSPVPAWKARSVVFALLQEAQVIGDDVMITSFDRLFPNQDKLSGKNFGNLIALPFQGKAMEQGHTLFLDPETGFKEPYDSQWPLLENLESVSEKQLDDLISEWNLDRGASSPVPQTPPDPTGAPISNSADKDFPPADFEKIKAGCSFIYHSVENASTLAEPEWWAMMSNVIRCENGKAIAHEVSKPYPNYSPEETDQYIQKALSKGPHTCLYIEQNISAKYCKHCGLRTFVKAPVVIGLPDIENGAQDIPDIIDKLKESNDAVKVYDYIDVFAKASATELAKVCMQLKEMFKEKLNLNDFRRAIKDKKARLRKMSAKQTHSTLPQIIVNDRQLRHVASEAQQALEDANNPPKTFIRSGRLVQVYVNEKFNPSTVDLKDNELMRELSLSADFLKKERDGFSRNVHPPTDVVKYLLAGNSWNLPPLRGIIEAPTLRDDGTIISTPGYDQKTGLFYYPSPTLAMPSVSASPTIIDARNAAQWLLNEVLVDFPFVNDASKINALGLMITPAVRHIIDGPVPNALINAPTPASGKSLLCDAVSMVVAGRPAAMFGAPKSNDEWAKKILSALMDGYTLITFDNIEGTLRSASLSRAITCRIFADRVLGISKTEAIACDVTWVCNGNNVQLSGDLPRRTYWIEIDPKTPDPYKRTGFRHPKLLPWIADNRGEVLSKVLIVCRAWWLAGKPVPKNLKTWGSFEDWTSTIGGILEYAGVHNFLGNLDKKIRESDTVSVQWTAFLNAWHDSYGDQSTTVAEAFAAIPGDVSNSELYQSLPDELSEAFDTGNRTGFKRRLGIALGQMEGRRFSDEELYLEKVGADSRSGAAKWRVVIGKPRMYRKVA